jgi:hypothetical protein
VVTAYPVSAARRSRNSRLTDIGISLPNFLWKDKVPPGDEVATASCSNEILRSVRAVLLEPKQVGFADSE